ncbi:HEPN domain-containing protein [Jiangella sp. DSM 45060]|uniref:ApeA N-terminal domain 1-containing protein n=1 Tax=Jiangella sp. DSM 45060 TaxID=1798224 RepID=UPI0012FD03C7|nr:HEPN domain-containing protein [Jiangella sp. DSM 45060]
MAALDGIWDEDIQDASIDTWHMVPNHLYGRVFGKAVTLIGTRVVNHRTVVPGGTQATVRATYALEGSLWLEPEECRYDELRIQFWDQEPWSAWAAYSYVLSKDFHESTIKRTTPDPIVAEFPGARIQLEDATTIPMPSAGRPVELRDESAIRIKFDQPLSFEEITNVWLIPIELLIITSSRRLSGIRSLAVTNSTWQVDGKDLKGPNKWMTIRTSHSSRDGMTDLSHHDTLYTLKDLDFPSLITRASAIVNSHRYSIEQYASLMSRRQTRHVEAFMSWVRMVESFSREGDEGVDGVPPEKLGDRDVLVSAVGSALQEMGWNARRRKPVKGIVNSILGPSLEQRLLAMEREAGHPVRSLIPEDDEDRWANRVAYLRNIASHGLPPSKELVNDVRQVQGATAALRVLFDTRWLVELGFPVESANQLVQRHRDYYSLRDVARNTLLLDVEGD